MNQNSAVAFNNLAKGLKDLGRFDEAIIHFERAIALAPNFADAQFSYGTALHLMNRFEDALVHFEKAIALNPKFIVALNNRGLALAKLKRFTEALASYDQALAVQPNFGDAHNNRGNALTALMRFEDALASFDRAIAARPDSAEAHCNRGNALLELGRFDDAAAAFDRAIAIRPDFAEAHRGRGDALAHLNRFDEAMASFDRAIAIKSLYVDAWISRAETLFTCNRNDEAVKSAQAAIDIDPENALCRFLSCVCELRILYDNEDDVDARRRAYENKLRAICSDYEAGRLETNMIEAIAHCKPFYLAYQGRNDRDLQTLVRDPSLPGRWRSVSSSRYARGPRSRRTDPSGLREQPFLRALELENSAQRLDEPVGPQSFQNIRLPCGSPARPGNRRRGETLLSICASRYAPRGLAR